jgi:hypothetical protein
MASLKPQLEEQRSSLKIESIYASLDTALDFAKIALYSDDENEIVRCRKKACDTYEGALDSLRTAVLTDIEWESAKTKMEHLEYVLLPSKTGQR